MIDLSSYNAAQLRSMQEEIEKEIVKRRKQDLEAARDRLYAVAHDMNMPFDTLLETLGMVKPGTVKLARAASAPAGKKQPGKVAVKYRHPDHPTQEWTGRGRTPAWVKNYLEHTGKPLESLLIAGA